MNRNASVLDTHHYEVLGVSPASTMAEIKAQYRALIRQYHPDMHNTPEASAANVEKFRQVQEAWEWVQWVREKYPNTHQATSESETADTREYATVDGHPVIIVTGTTVDDYWHQPRRTTVLQVSLDVAKALRHRSEIIFDGITLDAICVIEGNKELFRCSIYGGYIYGFDTLLAQFENDQRRATFTAQLQQLKQQQTDLYFKGRPIIKLAQFTRELEQSISLFGTRRGKSEGQLRAFIRTCEREIERIKDGGSQLLVDGLLDGSLPHPDLDQIQRVIDAIKVASIRSNGFIEPFDETQLRQHYERQIGSLEDARELPLISLALKLQDYVPDDVMKELEDAHELAPTTIDVPSRKGLTAYQVEYMVIEEKGQPVTVGMITIPLAVYEKNAREYGKPSTFPVLPFGIRLYLRITLDAVPIAEGFDEEELTKKITKLRTSQKRGKAIAGVGVSEFSDRRYSPIEATPLPFFYRGARPRW